VRPSVPLAVAAEAYLNRTRKRPLNAIDASRIKELDRKFGARRLDEIADTEWAHFVDARMMGRAAVTRERYIDLVCSFLAWCKARPRQWLAELPVFDRDKEAGQSKESPARRVGELHPELIARLIAHAAPHLRGQMAIKWSAGARVSSIIYGCRLCDYLAAPGREQITFHDTKNGQRVEAAVHPWAAAMMAEYLAWRGRLEDRQGPLFLTDRRRPYADNGKAAGGQTKTAFKGMLRRTIASLRSDALAQAATLRRAGQGAAARAHWRAVRDGDIALLGQLTPHWFRHLLATTLLASGDMPSTMAQGGWRDARSVMRYAHDVPARRRQLVGQMAAPGTFWPREPAAVNKK
jgi:integrase